MLQLIDRQTGEVTFVGQRATRSLPCPICSHLHRTQGWCLVDPTRGLTICPRVESPRRIGEAGWLHGAQDGRQIPSGAFVVRSVAHETPLCDWDAIWGAAVERATNDDLARLAGHLGIPEAAVAALEVGVHDEAWAFRMVDSHGRICGIKLRTAAGKKLCVTGSRLGLIVPTAFDADAPALWITEGESDCMVAALWGLNAVARMGCRSSVQQIVERSRGREVVIVADKDDAGMTGARQLSDSISRAARSCTIVTPKAKDLRAWFLAGATGEDLVWRVKSIRGW